MTRPVRESNLLCMVHHLASLDGSDHELVHIARDSRRSLLCVVAIHSTTLGPAVGGLRRTAYPSLVDAVGDALNLSRAMTLKNSFAGLPLGGGKAVVADDAATASSQTLDAFAEVLEVLGGRYLAAEDIGTSPQVMDYLGERTAWVAGRSIERGGTGNPAPSTAQTVLAAIEAAVELRLHSDLTGRRIGIVGAGNVGGRLARALAARGAEVLLTDIDPSRDAVTRSLPSVRFCAPEELLSAELDVLAPCARGGVITSANIGAVRAPIICGAANNQLADDALADGLHDMGVLYVPDFVANAGGIVQIGGEVLSWDAARIADALDDAAARARSLLIDAESTGTTPLALALRRAEDRIEAKSSAAWF